MGNLSLQRKLWIFWACGEIPSNDSVLPKKFNLSDSKRTLFHCQFQSCLAEAIENGRMFWVLSVAFLAANPISSMYWAHWSTLTTGSKFSRRKLEKADRDLLRSSASLLSFVTKISATKIDCKHSHRPLVCHLQAVIRLGAIKLAEERFHCQVFCCVRQSAHGVNIIGVIIWNQSTDFLQIHK